ncbi:MAG: hypothetical protein AAF456_13400 [Planctomycetota bacterium]
MSGSGFMENVKVINSAVRTGLALIVLGGVGWGSYVGYDRYIKPGFDAERAKADLVALQEEFAQQEEELERTKLERDLYATSLKLIKLDHRVAEIEVLDKGINEDGQPFHEVRFIEIDDAGNTVGAEREFTLTGDQIRIDTWIVSFEDHYVEGADELRGRGLCVFKGIYGEIDGPLGAKPLDIQSSDSPPGVYKTEEQNAFEQQIWNDFWEVCNDEERQAELGISAAFGQVNYIKPFEKGKRYLIELHSSGSTSIKPISE